MPHTSKTKSKRSLRVFLCHASDDKPTVRGLYKRLRAEGIDPWLDEQRLLPGQRWEDEILKSVESADAVIVCLSSNSITKRGYVQKEIRYALDIADRQPQGTIYIIPVRLEHCEVPARLQAFHWADLYAKGGYKNLMGALNSCTNDTIIIEKPRKDNGAKSVPQKKHQTVDKLSPEMSKGRKLVPIESHPLTELQSQLLYALQKMERNSPLGVTSEALAEWLVVTKSTIRKNIRRLGDGYVISVHTKPLSYRLNMNSVVTWPETAFILIKLSSFPQERPFMINRARFTKSLMHVDQLTGEYVEGCINAAINTGYIQGKVSGYIFPSPRIADEERYLKLIAMDWAEERGIRI